MIIAKEELISLREAAKISGYSPDYIGQLIRSGKLDGKQVFSNVAWMTTEEALLSYLSKDAEKRPVSRIALRERLLSSEAIAQYYLVLSGVLIATTSVFILFLAYVTAVGIDHKIEQRSLQSIQHIDHDT